MDMVHIDISAADYHRRTKHQLQRFAAGPDTLDWDAQPQPFRTWAGAPTIPLPMVADELTTTWGQMQAQRDVAPHALSLHTVACLLELSFALTAWKQFGPDRWALRANPSSGNLHPTEVYVLASGVEGLPDGLYHYEPFEHALACRAHYAPVTEGGRPSPRLWIGLSAIQWREAWKYGERAFRYCQLDAGHALGALRYAAASLGWQALRLPALSHAALAPSMGLDREADFGRAEREEPDMLMAVGPVVDAGWAADRLKPLAWFGQASRLDPRPMYAWPVIDEVTHTTRPQPPADGLEPASHRQVQLAEVGTSQAAPRAETPAASIIRGRRSAQHFDRHAQMTRRSFEGMVQSLVPVNQVPWDAWPHVPRVHAIFYVHRVEGVEPGVYVLPRSAAGEALLRQEILSTTNWELAWTVLTDEQGVRWPLWCVAEHPNLAGVLRQLSCHQAIASDACWAMSLVAEFEVPLAAQADAYRQLLQEAGLMGQALYLNAEAHGYRGTGIGCYFDDAVHHLLSLDSERLQVLYHFTVGVPMADSRITTEPPYAHLTSSRQEDAA